MQVFNQNIIITKDTVQTQGRYGWFKLTWPHNKRKHCQRLWKHQPATHSCTYIGNDRELADSTENVVPNPCTQEDSRKASVSKMCWCKGKQKEDRHKDKETKRKDSVEYRRGKWLKSPGQITGLTDWRNIGPCVMSVPMSLHLTASGRRISVTNFAASRRISITLLSKANAGARGKEATNKDTNPYWITVIKDI